MAFDQISIKGRALRLLAGREHSRAELERKLKAHESEPGELARALDELDAKGFINEQRVLESVVHRRAARLGAARVKQELQAKGLDPAAVTEAVAVLRGTEVERARRGLAQEVRHAAGRCGRARQADALSAGARLQRRSDPARCWRRGRRLSWAANPAR